MAVGFLLLDAALLVVAGILDRRPALLGGSVVCLALVVLVLTLRRRYARRLAEIAKARAMLRQELRAVKPPDGNEARS